MQAIAKNQPEALPPPEEFKAIKLHKGSASGKIIKYLLEHGPTSGSDLQKALKLANSPQAYTQPHIVAGRLVCKRMSMHHAVYSIHPDITADHFVIVDKPKTND